MRTSTVFRQAARLARHAATPSPALARRAAIVAGARAPGSLAVLAPTSGNATGPRALSTEAAPLPYAGVRVLEKAGLLSGRLASASPVAGNLLELDAIAAVVIGGTSLAGGRATMVGTFLGVLTFAVIFNLLALLSLPAEIQNIVKGGIIVAAVVLQRRDG